MCGPRSRQPWSILTFGHASVSHGGSEVQAQEGQSQKVDRYSDKLFPKVEKKQELQGLLPKKEMGGEEERKREGRKEQCL